MFGPLKEKSSLYRELSRDVIENEGRSDYFKLRKKWSWSLLGFLIGMFVFQAALTVLIGLRIFDFKEYKFFLNLVVGENFLQIVGMCIMVVGFLFPKSETPNHSPLKIEPPCPSPASQPKLSDLEINEPISSK